MELYLHFNTPSWLGAQLKLRDNFTFTSENFLFSLTKMKLIEFKYLKKLKHSIHFMTKVGIRIGFHFRCHIS
jgi:hypothetical protein